MSTHNNKEPVLNWKAVKRFSSVGSDIYAEDSDLGLLLKASTANWQGLFAGKDVTWTQTMIVIRVLAKCNVMCSDFPHLFDPVIDAVWKSGFEEILRSQLNGLCNALTVNKAELEECITKVYAFSPSELICKLESTFSELNRRFQIAILSDKRVSSVTHSEGTFPSKAALEDGYTFQEVLGRLERPPISTRGLLQWHCEMLSEDFMYPLRKGLEHLRRNARESAKEDLYCYGLIRPRDCRMAQENVAIDVQLMSQECAYADIDWECSSRLLPGSLLILQQANNNNFVLATVENRDVAKLSKGCITLCPLGSEECAAVMDAQSSFHLYESKVYFEAYRHTVGILRVKRSIPFSNIFMSEEKFDSTLLQPPSYLDGKGAQKCDIRALMRPPSKDANISQILDANQLYATLQKESADESNSSCSMSLDELLSGPAPEKVHLNESQLQAFRQTLSHNVSLIQGPPGTGKTFIGQVLLSFLHQNRRNLWPMPKPIVLICYTNHVLDSLLERLLPVSQKIIRVGGRSRSAALENHTLAALRRSVRESRLRNRDMYQFEKRLEWELGQQKQSLEQDMHSFSPGAISDANLGELQQQFRRLQDLQHLESARLLGMADFVGFTTTGAAKYHSLLRRLKPRVILLEEAGQVLEGHSLASIPASCEHLIMIGDHQQLRPVTAAYHLAKEHGLNISLFERLISKGVPYARLHEQHRMRPDISSVMTQVYYPGLRNHRSVYAFPGVKGVEKSMFFLCHDFAEDRMTETRSRVNILEAEFVLGLARFLLKVGYSCKDITILTTYVGQLSVLQKLIRSEARYRCVVPVQLSVVDNFQGEENKIVLVSLVRSGTGSIGFLSQDGRSCVALSRAKWGLFVVGNMADMERKSDTWKRIASALRSQHSLGYEMTLVCPYHGTKWTVNASSFRGVDVAGFCAIKCGLELGCGHKCSSPCHWSDRGHRGEFRCQRRCTKTCPEGHPCAKLCSEACFPCENTSVKVFQPCGHTVAVACPSLRRPEKCEQLIVCTLKCGHVKEAACSAWSEVCSEPCNTLLPCSHECGLSCHRNRPEAHRQICGEPCTRRCNANLHQCGKACWEKCDEKCTVEVARRIPCEHGEATMPCHISALEYECTEKCDRVLPCGHSCKAFCYECVQAKACLPCTTRITGLLLPCGHEVKNIRCAETERFVCKQKCAKTLACGTHKCSRLCFETCDNECSRCPKDIDLSQLDLNETTSSSICLRLLSCGHECSRSATECLSSETHAPCAKPCQRVLLCGHECQASCGQPCPPCQGSQYRSAGNTKII